MAAKKLYIIAGEASGDLHGSNLMKELLKQEPSLEMRFWGGDKMAAVAGKPVKHIKDLAFMGFLEVILNLKTILGNIRFCKEDIAKYKPDTLILIDYPGFNMRIAEWAHEQGIQVLYYISPQIWAWKQNRVHKIKKVVDKVFCILPFEKDFYAKFGVEVEFVGNPLIDAIVTFESEKFNKAQFYEQQQLDERPIIAILPGSRVQEVKLKLPIMLEAVKNKLADYQIVIAGAPNLEADFYASILGNNPVKIVYGNTYGLLSVATTALVTSGTATLETALFEVPEVVCYKGSYLSYLIARQLIKVKYISLVNLIMDREVVKECIQADCNPKLIASELDKILPQGEKHAALLSDYKTLKKILGGVGASEETAKRMLKTMQTR
ncbi:MAG: lipid-A-disaccharide synthase [Crocinitomicaceae bacterium]